MSSNIRRSNDSEVEIAVADFFHWEKISEQVVESTRLKYMLKQTQLVGDELWPPTKQNWRYEQISFFGSY